MIYDGSRRIPALRHVRGDAVGQGWVAVTMAEDEGHQSRIAIRSIRLMRAGGQGLFMPSIKVELRVPAALPGARGETSWSAEGHTKWATRRGSVAWSGERRSRRTGGNSCRCIDMSLCFGPVAKS